MCWYKSVENEHGVYRGEDLMKKICKSLKEHAMEIVNFEKKKMNPGINEQK